jgi:YVTN family beta-propeller protein
VPSGSSVVNGRLGTLFQVDPDFGTVSKIELAGRSVNFATGGVDVAGGTVWAVFGDSTLARFNPTRIDERGTGLAGSGPAALVFGYGSVWVANSADSEVQQFSPRTFEEGPIRTIPVGREPTGLAAGEDAIWTTSSEDDLLTRIDAGLGLPPESIPVGDGPTAVAVGGGATWVTNTREGTVSRIDPETNTVENVIAVGNAPAGVAVAGDSVWVAVQAP